MTGRIETPRRHAVTAKVPTPFGSMYLHVDFDRQGRLCGGTISDPQKEPDAQVAALVRALSAALDDVLAFAGGRPRAATGPEGAKDGGGPGERRGDP